MASPAPPPVPSWLVPWTLWVLGGKHDVRPVDAPVVIPAWAIWFPAWCKWRMAGQPAGKRPAKAPYPVPQWVWAPLTDVVRATKYEAALAFWRRMGTWVTRLDHFPPEGIASEYGGGHYDYVVVPTLTGTVGDTNGTQGQLASWVARAKTVGLKVVGSQWGKATNTVEAEAEAEAAVKWYTDLRLDGWCINGEKKYEGGGKSAAYARRFRSRLPFIPLLWSPEPRLDLDHAVLQTLGVAYGPQAYPLENGWDIEGCVEWADNFGYKRKNVIPLIQAYLSPAGVRFPADWYREQAQAAGLPGLILYTANQCMDDKSYWLDLLVD